MQKLTEKAINKFNDYVKKWQFQKYEKYLQKKSHYENMPSDQLLFEYINQKSKYEYKKGILTLFIVSIGLALLMNVWKKFFSFMESALKYTSTIANVENFEIAQVSFYISISTAAFVTILIIFFLFTYVHELVMINKELILIAEIRNRKTEK